MHTILAHKKQDISISCYNSLLLRHIIAAFLLYTIEGAGMCSALLSYVYKYISVHDITVHMHLFCDIFYIKEKA